MSRKRSAFVIESKAKWKPVAIDFDDDNDFKHFEGLVSFEELHDYQVTRGEAEVGRKGKRKSETDGKSDGKKKKAKKTKRKKATEAVADPADSKCSPQPPPRSIVPVVVEQAKEEAPDEIDMSAWNGLFVPDSVIEALKRLKFDSPMPIQSLTLPSAIRDRMDILGASETGSGKTLAFAIPLIHFILNEKESEEKGVKKVRALILTPTRELAVQVKKHIENVSKLSDVSVAVVVGGLSVQKQERILKKHCPDILVATPGRLWELIESATIDHLNVDSINRIKYLVIDEADRMTEQGHFDELKRLIELLKQNEHIKGRQTFVFSATLTLIHELPKRLQLGNRSKNKANSKSQSQKLSSLIMMLGMRTEHTKVIDLTRQGIGTPNEQMLTETKINCLIEEKDLYLYYFLFTCPGRTIVFCNSKDCLRRVVNILKLLQMNPLHLHADLPQKRRLVNLERFAQNPKAILLASDVAARGLDIPNVDHVVHYQIPQTAEVYIHRSGRTARAYNKGLSLMLCDPKEEARFYRKLCQTMNRGNELENFPIDQSFLKLLKERVDVVRKYDQMEHQMRKTKANSDWFYNAAQRCDMEIDDQMIGLDSKQDEKQVRLLKSLKIRLASLLKKPLIPRNHLTAFITKTGSLKVPDKKASNAIEMVKKVKTK